MAAAANADLVLMPGAPNSQVVGISADGTIAAGNGPKAFTWSQAAGRSNQASDPNKPAYLIADAISGDGRAVIGSLGGAAAIWRGPGKYQDIGQLSTQRPWAYTTGVNNDASVICGYSTPKNSQGNGGRAWVWTPGGGMQDLGDVTSGAVAIEARGVSRDGSTVVGLSSGASEAAFSWTFSGGMSRLPDLYTDYRRSSQAYGVNFDGSIVVGSSGLDSHAVLWKNGVLTDLGQLAPGTYPLAVAVSDDGGVVVGRDGGGGRFSDRAIVWTPATGLETLADYFSQYGVFLPAGAELTNCTCVSADGRTFGGTITLADGTDYGFVATIPSPATLGVMCGACFVRRRRSVP